MQTPPSHEPSASETEPCPYLTGEKTTDGPHGVACPLCHGTKRMPRRPPAMLVDARVTIEGSLGKLVRARFALMGDAVLGRQLVIYITVPNARGEGVLDGLSSHHWLTEYQFERCTRDAHFLAKTVRAALIATMTHEVDESLMIDGKRFREPDHWGPR